MGSNQCSIKGAAIQEIATPLSVVMAEHYFFYLWDFK